MNLPLTPRSMAATIAVALPLLFAASHASAAFQLRVPVSPVCAHGACAGGGGGGGGGAFSVAWGPGNGFLIPTRSVTVTGGTGPFTYSVQVLAAQESEAGAWSDCTGTTATEGQTYNGNFFQATCGYGAGSEAPALRWSTDSVATGYSDPEVGLAVETGGSGGPTGYGFGHRFTLTVTDSIGATAVTPVEEIWFPGY